MGSLIAFAVLFISWLIGYVMGRSDASNSHTDTK